MTVLGPVTQEEQNAGRGQALDQLIQQSLAVGVDPLEVFEHEAERLLLALAEQEASDGVQDTSPPLGRVEVAPRGQFDAYVEEREHGLLGIAQRLVQAEDACGHLVADL